MAGKRREPKSTLHGKSPQGSAGTENGRPAAGKESRVTVAVAVRHSSQNTSKSTGKGENNVLRSGTAVSLERTERNCVKKEAAVNLKMEKKRTANARMADGEKCGGGEGAA